MTKTFCERCGEEIKRDAYQVRIVLVNADKTAAKNAVDKTGDFHANCAAFLFRAFDGEGYERAATAA